ncbi:MAG: hypothetical protein IPH95_03115 [Candidatus Promineofilum sp.]|nr:hypothetical protein [Promineifilum sp.]
MIPAIAIPAFNRPASLARLLAALAAADVAAGTPLLIAVDCPADAHHAPANAAVLALARAFRWPHGPLEIVVQPAPLGLVGNVFYCGAAAETYGAVALLEDDLLVSARFHAYARQALAAYAGDDRLAGLSLNSPWANGFTHQPFVPLLDDDDVYFLQLSTPQGQVYTAAQWRAFREWTATAGPDAGAAAVHDLLNALPADDWLGLKARYLAATGRLYVYPRESLTTNPGAPGTHFDHATAYFRVPMQELRRDFRFLSLDAAAAVYDGFYELLPARLDRLTDRLHGYDYVVDLYATKPSRLLTAGYVLTTRPCRRVELAFGRDLWPLEANVIAGTPGRGISLARRADVLTGPAATLAAQHANDATFARTRPPGRRQRWRAALAGWRYRRLL